MSGITIVILIFSVLGAVDYILGNKLGIGDEFKRAFSLFCPMALSMLGMIVIAPALGVWLMPFFQWFYDLFGIDPSIIPASLFANDMGGMQLARSVCVDKALGDYNALVISSMMGCVISFTIPFSLGLVKEAQRRELFFGFLCGIATIPIGSFAAGLVCKLPPLAVLIDLLPLLILSVIVAVALVFVPKVCIKCFEVFGICMKILAIIGLVLAVFTFLTGIRLSPHFDTFENGAFICANACVTLSGALPLMFLVSKLLDRPLNELGSRLGINGISALSFLGSLVTNASTFGVMEKMDRKGVVLNAAFAVSASFVFGSHLAFTMVFDSAYVAPMVVGKLVSGICAVVLAMVLYRPEKDEQHEQRDC
ncbi:MAG: ethanolamine utilization protein EutH [Oscillospiraceae bacterium]|nr:ethanolamine utilization protein EutH [Oscillospiraceae bacterium]